MNVAFRLLLLAAAVGLYQLPIVRERSSHITVWSLEPVVSTALESLDTALANLPDLLHDWLEAEKIALQAQALTALEGVPEPRTVSTDYAGTSAASKSPNVPRASVQLPQLAAVALATSTSPPGAVVASPSGLPPKPTTAEDGHLAASGGASALSALMQPTNTPAPALSSGTILLVGDSVMGEIAYGLKRWSAKNKQWTVVDAHKVSSGLCNSGYYDWPTIFSELVAQNKPTVIAMMVGANDEQDIFVPHKHYGFGTADWLRVYAERINAIVATARQAHATLYWDIPPVMREAGVEKKMLVLRKVLRDTLAAQPDSVVVIDEAAPFADKDGHYVESGSYNGKVRALRADDGIHLTALGAQVYVDALLHAAFGQGLPLTVAAGSKQDSAEASMTSEAKSSSAVLATASAATANLPAVVSEMPALRAPAASGSQRQD